MRTYYWRRKAFEKLAEIGLLVPDDHFSLQKISLPSSQHAATIRRVVEPSRGVFLLQQLYVRVQLLRRPDLDSEPAFDVVSEEASFDEIVTVHPTTAVVKKTSASLSFDCVLDAFRSPKGAPCESPQVLSPHDMLAPRARAGAFIEIGRLFPNPRA